MAKGDLPGMDLVKFSCSRSYQTDYPLNISLVSIDSQHNQILAIT